ncbi:MAG: type VI secretion system-associated protein TagF [Pseudomonadota bacterium]
MQRNLNGYFGKLPDRADFVTARCPDGFLKLWEPFLMRGLAHSRQHLAGDWEDAYMTMPVWRFLLKRSQGDEALSQLLAGALMPSVDKVGRKFPLTIVAAVDGAEVTGEPAQGWYDEVEAVLLGALREEAALSDFQEAVAGLAAPDAGADTQTSSSGKDVEPDQETKGQVASRFWCGTGTRSYRFDCDGLPAPEEFRWLLLPETFRAHRESAELAGQQHGRYQEEDHRT